MFVLVCLDHALLVGLNLQFNVVVKQFSGMIVVSETSTPIRRDDDGECDTRDDDECDDDECDDNECDDD